MDNPLLRIGKERLDKLAETIKQRNHLCRDKFRNKIDIERLTKTNEEIEKKIHEIDSEITALYRI